MSDIHGVNKGHDNSTGKRRNNEEGRSVKRVLLASGVFALIVYVLSCMGAGQPAQAIMASSAMEGGSVQSEARAWSWWLPFSSSPSSDNLPAVIPGGQSIGIKLRSSGILVVGYHLVHQGKNAVSPGIQANLHVGDTILFVDGARVSSVSQVARLIDAAGKRVAPLHVSFSRHGKMYRTALRPLYDQDSGSYRIGLYIRDSASGVGTLTFYVPGSHSFGALGHVIADADTGEPIDGRGQIVHASVTSVDRGESGQPGEIRGQFVDERHVVGSIDCNTEFGVFGRMFSAPDHGLIERPVPVADPSQVHPGKAQILTVVSGQKVERFDVVIVRVNHQSTAQVKGLIVRVTDPSLINRTGGIVQGMSGSPILQDGRLVGAVTHVFVSDPTQGYGIFAAWMLRSAVHGPAASLQKAA